LGARYIHNSGASRREIAELCPNFFGWFEKLVAQFIERERPHYPSSLLSQGRRHLPELSDFIARSDLSAGVQRAKAEATKQSILEISATKIRRHAARRGDP